MTREWWRTRAILRAVSQHFKLFVCCSLCLFFVFNSVPHVKEAPCFWELRRSFSVYWVIRIGLMVYEGTIISFVKLMRHVCIWVLRSLVVCVKVVLLVDKCQNCWVHVVGESVSIRIIREVWGLSSSILLLFIWDMGSFKGVLWFVAIENA